VHDRFIRRTGFHLGAIGTASMFSPALILPDIARHAAHYRRLRGPRTVIKGTIWSLIWSCQSAITKVADGKVTVE
jgi:hypothetical protein